MAGPKTPTEEEAEALAAARLSRTALPKTACGQPIIMEREEGGKLRRLVSCGNTHDPADPNADRYIIHDLHRNHAETIREHRRWLSKMIVADPLPNEHYTVEELKAMGLVGVYTWEDVPEDEQVRPYVVMQ